VSKKQSRDLENVVFNLESVYLQVCASIDLTHVLHCTSQHHLNLHWQRSFMTVLTVL